MPDLTMGVAMRPEFEGKVIGVDPGLVEGRIAGCGGLRLGEKQQRRYVYDLAPGRWLRLRDTGTGATLCVKEYAHDGIGGTSEIETSVGDFGTAHELLVAAGHTTFSYQENRRTSFSLDGAELELDSWPGIPPYLEIEGENAEQVHAVAARIGFSPSQLTGMATLHVYAAYGLDVEAAPSLTFTDPPRADVNAWTGSVTVSKARALVLGDDGTLLLERRQRRGQNRFWVLPGGGVEPGDASLEDAVCRELTEETGGTFDIGRLATIAYTHNNRAHHAIFTGRLHDIDPARRAGPEVDHPDGSYELEAFALDPGVLEPLDIWPPTAKTWLLNQLHRGADLATVPDLRDGGPIAFGPFDPTHLRAAEREVVA